MGRVNALYNTLIRDHLVVAARSILWGHKVLILDMDWYRWALAEKEIRGNLYTHPELARYAEFLRIDRKQIFDGKCAVQGVDTLNYKNIYHEDINLWNICRTSMAYRTGELLPDMAKKENLAILSDFYSKAISGIVNLRKVIARLNPDSVLVSKGGAFETLCVKKIAGEFGIAVIEIENSMIGGFVLFDRSSGDNDQFSLARPGSGTCCPGQVTQDQRRWIYSLWKEKLAEKALEHKTGGIDSPARIRKLLDVPEDKKLVLLLGQVRVDSAITMFSHLYSDPVDMIEEASRITARLKDVVLVIRLHPKEISGLSPEGIPYDNSTLRELQKRNIHRLPNIRIVADPEINTFSLMDIAWAGLTVTSQAGLEMCIKGKPVMVCGAAFYGGRGFTIDLPERGRFQDMYISLINRATMTEERRALALDFMYSYYKRHFFDHELTVNQESLLRTFLGHREEIRE